MNPYTKAVLFIVRLVASGFILFGAHPQDQKVKKPEVANVS
ncbi:MAG: hypothetical protein ABIQ35_14035 [Verrucomicrobiota bacterium]